MLRRQSRSGCGLISAAALAYCPGGRCRGLRLEAAAVVMPHPEKEQTGGEDAMFTLRRSFGVFDGVGGWADAGVDAGLYSRSLAKHTSAALKRCIGESAGPIDLVSALREGVHRVHEQGSCTACLVHVADDGKFSALNVGDSGFRVLRPSHHADGMLMLAMQSTQQQHYFNCPLQLGTGSRDLPEHGDRYSGMLQPGDVLLLATDGCFDNLFDNEISELLDPEHRAGQPASHLATLVGRAARTASLQTTRPTPFSASAKEHGYNFPGGKVDDVTVVCVLVLDEEESAAPRDHSIHPIH